MNISWKKHPQASTIPLLDIEEEIYLAAIASGVLVIRGSWFRAEGDAGEDLFFRATYAAATSENISEAIRRFGDALRDVFQLGGQIGGEKMVEVEGEKKKAGELRSVEGGEERVPLA